MSLTSDIFGALGIPDDDYTFVQTFGQEPIFDATQQLLGNHNADLAAFEAVFVERTTYNHKTRYYLATGGRFEKVTNNSRAMDVKAQGSWDVAYPLEEYGRRIAGNRVQMAYMSTGQYMRHLESVRQADVNTRRWAMLKTLFNNAPAAFLDENWGSLTLVPLANSDGTLYPPIVGSEVTADAQHYLSTTYAPTAISDTNDPITPMIDLLEGHFGIPTGGSNIAVFINKAEVAAVEALTAFNPIEHRFQDLAITVTQAVNYPATLPGRTLGEYGGKALIQRWDWIPAHYMLAVHLDAPRPITKRIDPPQVGLPEGLQLISQTMEHPFRDASWTNRFGYSIGNRLNGAATFVDSGNAYTIPTQYNY